MTFKNIIKKLLPLGLAAVCAFSGFADETVTGNLYVTGNATVSGTVNLVNGGSGVVHIGPQNNAGEGAEIAMGGSNGNPAFRFDNLLGHARFFWGDSVHHQFQIFNHGSGTTGMYVEGYTGIGTSDPKERLDVNGAAKANSFVLSAPDTGWRNQLRFESSSRRLQHLFYQDSLNGNRLVLNLNYHGDAGVQNLFMLGGNFHTTGSSTFDGTVNLVNGNNGVVHIGTQNNAGEGAEIAMIGSGGHATFRLDNLNGNSRVFWYDGQDHQFQIFNAGQGNTGLYVEGNVGIGTLNPDYKLDVNGVMRAKEVIVETGWADYVFEDEYELAPLSEVEDFIEENGHLPNIPSAAEISENGLSIADVNTKMMEKIEELTLYVIEIKKENEELKAKVEALEDSQK